VSEFTTTSLKDFLLVKYLDRPLTLFGWRFELDRYYLQPGDGIPRGVWVDRTDEHTDGRVTYCLHWFLVYRWPHSPRRRAAWEARCRAQADD